MVILTYEVVIILPRTIHNANEQLLVHPEAICRLIGKIVNLNH
jgi:hypothetical protein